MGPKKVKAEPFCALSWVRLVSQINRYPLMWDCTEMIDLEKPIGTGYEGLVSHKGIVGH